MILLNIILKNLLTLLRNKRSAFITLIGPLILILLIGLAFTSSPSNELSVGIHAPDKTDLTNRFIDNMGEEGFHIKEFSSIDSCVDAMKTSNLQACISFPEDFTIKNNKTNIITFYVDNTRTNLVYEIIGTVSRNIGIESSEVTKDLTNNVLAMLEETGDGIEASIGKTILLKQPGNAIKKESNAAEDIINNIDLDMVEVSTSSTEEEYDIMKSLVQDMREQSQKLVDEGRDLVASVNSSSEIDDLEDAIDALDDYLNGTDSRIANAQSGFEDAINGISSSLAAIEAKFSSASASTDEVKLKLDEINSQVSVLHERVDNLKSDLERLINRINELKVTSGETISQPVVTKIEHVVTEQNSLSMIFPYLILLVVMFIGLLLPSTLIVMDKQSKASFRTFTTPVRDWVFMLGYFITGLIILIIQVAIVLAIAYYFIGNLLLANISLNLLILFVSMILFVLLGMSIGYLFSTQEGVTMITISVASILFFVSNLILPLENFSKQLQFIASLNPYVIASEALRRSILFSSSFATLAEPLVTLVSYAAIILVLTVVIKDVAKSRLMMKIMIRRQQNLIRDARDTYLRIGNTFVKDPEEFLLWLKGVDEKEFEENLSFKELRRWLSKKHKKKLLSLLVNKKSKEALIKIFEKALKK